ncbi:AMP-binding protein [Yoonia vestfoldensis]|uniref:AMP-binding protein n=1 Tax=Yoonia vestfoldensis TaxID=245188 RepID=UPI00037CA33A|nr:AMP-binding protein [Yoonia vestfoldensis]
MTIDPRKSVPAQLALALQTHADRVAITDADLSLTYGQLADCIGRLGAHLPDGAVAVFGKPSAVFGAAVTACVVMGRPFVHLDPAMPHDVLRNILMELDIDVVLLAEPAGPGQLPDQCHRVDVGQVIAGFADAPSAPVRAGIVAPDDIIYLVATSGTTGKPKCIPVTQDAAYLSYMWRDAYTPYGPDQTVGVYIFAIWEMFRPLRDGARLCFPRFSELMNPEALLAFLIRYQVTEMLFTPSAFDKTLQGWTSDATAGLALRRVILNGEVVSDELIGAAKDKLPDATIWNLYSICETHDICMTQVSGQTGPLQRGAVGKAMPYLRAVVLDDHDQPCPPGTPGLLHFEGPRMLGPGYVNRPEETALRFRELTIDGRATRLYDTGDQGYVTADHTIHVMGRVAHMLKLRGHSVQTRELTESLRGFMQFASAVPWVQDVAGQGKALVFYYCADADQVAANQSKWGVGAGQARMPGGMARALRAELPAYCVPSFLVRLDVMPLNPVSAKYDYKALPPVTVTTAVDTCDTTVLPTVAQAALVMGCAASSLDAAQSFHDQGGDSLMAVTLLLALEDVYGRPVDFDFALNVPLGRLHDLLSEAAPASQAQGRFDRPGILLTGATGFLGSRVLAAAARVLPQDEVIYCLIRPKRRNPLDRLHAIAADHGVDPARLVLVPAGIDDVRFGLTEADHAALAASVRQVIHCAAMVNLAVDRDHMESWSRAGIANVLQFCADAGADLRFSSSSAVFPDQGGRYPEGPTTFYPQSSGYGAAKIAAETQIAASGVRSAIVRLPSLYDLSAPNPNDIYEIIMAACARMGAVPEGLTFRMIAVDAAARFLAELAPPAGVQYYNLTPDIYATPPQDTKTLPVLTWLRDAPLSEAERALIASDLSVLHATATLTHDAARRMWEEVIGRPFAALSDPAALMASRFAHAPLYQSDPALT